MTATKSIHFLSNLKNVGIFDYIEDTVFMIKKKQTQECFIFKKVYNKQCNRDEKLQMMLQKAVFLFSQV